MARRLPTEVLVHVVWATQDRHATLPRQLDEELFLFVTFAASTVRCSVVAMGNASDHVHVLVRLLPTVALADLVQRLKGASCFRMNASGRLATRLRWQRGYFAESVSLADEEAVASYVRRQRSHHDDSNPAERWQLDETD